MTAQMGGANEGGAKMEHIKAQIGRPPILAAGNSGGDRELLDGTTPPRSRARTQTVLNIIGEQPAPAPSTYSRWLVVADTQPSARPKPTAVRATPQPLSHLCAEAMPVRGRPRTVWVHT
jgi:hypothetical protein